MTSQSIRSLRRFTLLVIIFGASVLALWSESYRPHVCAAAQASKEKAYPLPTAEEVKSLQLIGAAECKVCHSEAEPNKVDLYKETLGYEFIRLWENKVWAVHDLHSTAYKNLLTQRTANPAKNEVPNKTAQRMEDNLRRYKGENYTVATDVGCLACHASVLRPIPQVPPDQWTVKSFITSDGVGCEMCHGHGSLYKTRHRDSRIDPDNAPEGAIRMVDWREADPKIKSAWGLVNLRDHSTAVAQCASCHIGNLKEGRFVTHEWYAAGHPPLPPFDLVAFTREQPRHWGLPAELPYFQKLLKKDPKKAEAIFHIRAEESHGARRFAEATLATLREAVNLAYQLAEKGHDEGLDFAAFDCASCHHDLKYPSDRQMRGYVGKPGRPLFRPAAFALAKMVVEHAAQMKGAPDALKNAPQQLSAAERQMLEAFATKSLGDPAKIMAAAENLRKWCNETITQLASVRYTPDETKKLLAKVIDATQQPLADPEIAQLYTWSFETLVFDQTPPRQDAQGQLIPPPSVTAIRSKLQNIVVTRLRPDSKFDYEVPGSMTTPESLQPVDARLGTRMQIFNAFRFEPFRKAFQEIPPLASR
ncbi:MAG: multiheme c-type cytochrome [Gemmataceae bacterium]|nr:hypothetical protein [Gemmata sp.]MDW8195970.1 multiheme c-type cytochrome [Gemmataceae bacterium]